MGVKWSLFALWALVIFQKEEYTDLQVVSSYHRLYLLAILAPVEKNRREMENNFSELLILVVETITVKLRKI